VIRLSAAALAAALVVTAGSLYALSGAAEPSGAKATAARQVPTSDAALACPESPQSERTSTSVLAVTPPASASPATAASGSLTLRLLGDMATPIESASEVGVPLVQRLTASPQPSVVVDAQDAMSAGAAAFQWSLERGKKRSGRSISACAAASDDWWFSGVNTAVGATSKLVLTNPTTAIAVVDLEIFGPKGAVETVGQRGIALAPDSAETVDLARFAPNLDVASVRVHATAGLMTAAIQTSRLEGVTPAGSEWLPPAAEPGTDVVIDAAVDRSASQDLQIVNPADVSAIVQVQVVDDSGAFVPSGLESVSVPPQSTTGVSLGKISHDRAVAVRLTSPTPVTGAVISTARGSVDYAVSAPSASLADSAVVPVVSDVELAVEFTGTSQQAGGQYTLTGYDRDGQPVFDDTVSVDGLRTTEWTPPRGKRAGKAVYVVVSPTLAGDVQAVAQYRDKEGVAALPIVPGVFTVTRPAVTPAR
jgi:hypothetical protein